VFIRVLRIWRKQAPWIKSFPRLPESLEGEEGALAATATTPLTLGFLTVLHESAGYLGGYLVTNQWGGRWSSA